MTSYDKAERPKMTGDEAAVDDGSALDSVFASDRDRGGKSAPPESTPKETPAEPSEKPAGTEAASEGDDPSKKRDPFQTYRDPETNRLVPLNELKSEREKRQEFARKFEEAEKRAKDLEAKHAELERRLAAAPQQPFQQQPQQRQAPQLPPRPDPWTDPDGAANWDRHVQQLQFAAREQQRQDADFERAVAISEHLMSSVPDFGEKKALFVEAARSNPALIQQMVQNPLPAKFAYEMGKRIASERRVGNDVDAFEAQIRAEERQRVIEEMKAGTTANAQPQRFPGTLADATPSGEQGGHISREAVMSSVFDSNRDRRRK